MKTHYVIAYRGTGSYVYSIDENTGEALYTASSLEARLFDSMTEANAHLCCARRQRPFLDTHVRLTHT